MTPEERANKVREMLHPEGDLILPPGSIILIPDEAKELRLCIRAGIFGIPEGEVRRLCAMLGGGS